MTEPGFEPRHSGYALHTLNSSLVTAASQVKCKQKYFHGYVRSITILQFCKGTCGRRGRIWASLQSELLEDLPPWLLQTHTQNTDMPDETQQNVICTFSSWKKKEKWSLECKNHFRAKTFLLYYCFPTAYNCAWPMSRHSIHICGMKQKLGPGNEQ
jgi:hypothetical protein